MIYMAKRYVLYLLASLVMVAACGIAAGCARHQGAGQDEKKVEPVSETAPKFEPMRRDVPVVANAKPAPSVGDCAPKYANGLHGSCINNQPCRGIGVLDDQNNASCSCYAKAGGCNEGQRCDAIKKACVPENEPGFGHAADD
jgi:hypothetical protein